MKKTIIFLLLLTITQTSFGYDLTEKNQKIVDNIKVKVLKIFEKDPNRAYLLIDKVEKLLPNYINKPVLYYSLNSILQFTKDYIELYEQPIKDNNQSGTRKEDNVELFVSQIDKEISIQKESLKKLNISDLQIISSFEIEPKIDHLYLKNIYLENTGTISNINGLFRDIYLVDSENNIVSNGYALNNLLYFDISDYIIKKNTFQRFSVLANINTPDNLDQTGELTLNFSTPIDALENTSNGIRATSYSNGNYIISTATVSSLIKTLVAKSPITVTSENFVPTYSQAILFSVNNNSKDSLDLKSFEFNINGSFLDFIDDSSQFTLKRKGTNTVFGTANKADMVNNKLIITYTGEDVDYVSPNSSSEYILEINHVGIPDRLRAIRLENIVVGDGFGGTINNLKEYTNLGIPSNWYEYRY